ncbi:acyltransferase family protein [Shewanella sairae]|uniref:acyltransferase family protein n=1 Tax=Shewanella sairae TaxID=190310 RepID=UPI001C8052BD|nr:acyltransferase [Shewanella sairae]MCL1129303.1 acyltransferase [Shewanella sairae]
MERYRYSELDWLRVILILAVFTHHVLMPFNGDDWHIMNTESSKLLDDIMVYFEQLRLPTLFFIAGAGSLILLQRTTISAFIKSKFHRLFVPFIIGMVFVVPPQIYYENISDYQSLFDAYKHLVFSFEANHLWFIEFLITFMLLAPAIHYALNSKVGSKTIKVLQRVTSNKHGLFSLVLPLLILRLSLSYLMPSQSHSIDNLTVSLFYLFFFLAGMCFIRDSLIWENLVHNRATNLKWFLFSSLLLYCYYYKPDISMYIPLDIRWQLWWLVCTLVSWSGLLVLIGYASALCTSTPNWLLTANNLIYPFYILHQTVIVVLAYYIIQWEAGIFVKICSLLISSIFVCSTICYFLIKPFKTTRYLFGLKTLSSDTTYRGLSRSPNIE